MDLLQNKFLSIFLALICLSASAYISFDFEFNERMIPFTAQSLVIFVIAGLVTPQRFSFIVISYLVLGTIGLPIFADGSSGLDKLLGPSGGFLYGFLFAGLFISFFANKTMRLSTLILTMVTGTIVLFFFGLPHLSYKIGFDKAIDFGLKPFWPMSMLKAILSAFLVYYMRKWSSIKSN